MSRWSFAALAALLACGQAGDDATAGILTRDSAGVTIVEHPAGTLASTPVWVPGEPTMAIGGPDAMDELDATYLVRGWLLDDGFIAQHAREERLLRFDARGTVLKGFGKQGEGPDEFQGMYVLPLGGDSLVLVDARRGETRVVRANLTTSAPVRYSESRDFQVQPIGLLGDGSVVALYRTFDRRWTESSGPPRRDPLPLIRRNPGTGRWDTLTIMRDVEMYPIQVQQGGRNLASMRLLGLGANPLHSTFGDEVVVVDNSSYTLEMYNAAGLRRRVVLQDALRPVTAAIRESVIAEELGEGLAHEESEGMAVQMEDLIRSQQFSDSVSPYDRIIHTRDGRIWLRLTLLPMDTLREYLGFGASGQLERRLRLPLDWSPLDIDPDRILVRRTDDDDIGYLELRPLQRISP